MQRSNVQLHCTWSAVTCSSTPAEPRAVCLSARQTLCLSITPCATMSMVACNQRSMYEQYVGSALSSLTSHLATFAVPLIGKSLDQINSTAQHIYKGVVVF